MKLFNTEIRDSLIPSGYYSITFVEFGLTILFDTVVIVLDKEFILRRSGTTVAMFPLDILLISQIWKLREIAQKSKT